MDRSSCRDDRKTRISRGSIEKTRLVELSRRLALSKGIHQRNILEILIKRISYRNGYLSIELH